MIEKSRVAVIGGGLVGATAAIALARLGFVVTLVDRQRPSLATGDLGVDIRNVALSPASRDLLDDQGIWSGVMTAPYQHMVVWEQWGSGQLEFHATDVGRDELGWLVEMSPLLVSAWQRIDDTANLEVRVADIADIVVADDEVTLCFADGSTPQFDFLIAADGAQSIARRALELAVEVSPTHQVALATVVRTEQPHRHTAWQRFLTDGPLASLPSPDEHVCSIVWSQSPEMAQRRLDMDDDNFCRDLGYALEHRLGEVLAVDKRMAFPLTQQRVKNCAPHPRVLLIGDAMRVVHPLAGQGVNLGLEDVTHMLAVAAKQSNLAVPGIWQRYARQRQVRARLMIQTMAALQKIYASNNPAVSLLRNFGVQSFNALDGIKRQVMREAMGLGPMSGASDDDKSDSKNDDK